MMRTSRRLATWTLRAARQPFMRRVLRFGGRAAIDSAVGVALEAVPRSAPQTYTQVFAIKPPVTVYVRASHCRVMVRRDAAPKVILQSNVVRAFGLEFATEQDDAGVYIVVKRKPVVGQLSRADFSLTLPPDCDLALNLTPGEVVLQDVDGLIELPVAAPRIEEES